MSNPFRYFNSSPEIIRLAVLMYVKYPLSLRNVEDLLAERGIDISHETVRFWWNQFGPMFAAEIRKRRVAHMRGYPQWRWHLDEAFVKVNGKLCYLWRAVDHEGEVLEAVVTAKRDKAAALKFLKRIMKKYGRPLSVVTDGLCSYPAAMKEIGNADRQEAGRRHNNRAENSHQPFRRRERAMQRFRSMKTLQKFSSVHAQVHNHFNQERHLVTRQVYKTKALRRVGRVERPRGLIAAGFLACCAQRRRPAVALTKPWGGLDERVSPCSRRGARQPQAEPGHGHCGALQEFEQQAVLDAFDLSEKTYRLNQLRYDLRKLKGHGLIERDGSRYAYRLSPKGVQVALLFLFFHKRLCGPLANSRFHHRPDPQHRPDSRLEAAYHRADTAIQRVVDLLAAA